MGQYTRATAPDYQPYDEVRITTEPRFKTSDLSGNEWRISAVVLFIKKGIVVGRHDFHDVETAIRYLPVTTDRWSEMDEGAIEGAREVVKQARLCDQEGCAKKATRAYVIKKYKCKKCASDLEMYDWRKGTVVLFCEEHKHRGDSDLVDNDSNYEEVPLEQV